MNESKDEIAALGFSKRLYNILTYAGLDTVEKLEWMAKNKPFQMAKLDGLGKKDRAELVEKLEAAGIDCTEFLFCFLMKPASFFAC